MAVLRIDQLKKSYRRPEGGALCVVDVATFQMEAGIQMALKGASGSGKTTLLNLIAGILKADEESVTLAGQDMTRLNESGRDRLRALHLGYVFQTFNLLQGYTALENVEMAMAFGRGVDHQRATELLERVGLKERLAYFPRQLSTGQQQRVAVARALANRPGLVLADEPTGNLDEHHGQDVLALIKEVCRESKAALLLVSHDPQVLASFQNVQQLADINRALAPAGLQNA